MFLSKIKSAFRFFSPTEEKMIQLEKAGRSRLAKKMISEYEEAFKDEKNDG